MPPLATIIRVMLNVKLVPNQNRPGVGLMPASEGRRTWLPQQSRFCPVLEDGSQMGFLVYPPLEEDETYQVRYDDDGSYRFTFSKPDPIVTEFPVKKEYFTPAANWMEGWFDWLAVEFGNVFKGVTAAIRAVLDGLEVILVATPWPVVMLVIIVMAWRLAGPRVAVFSAAALAYLAMFGLWEVSMVTVALLGAAAFAVSRES